MTRVPDFRIAPALSSVLGLGVIAIEAAVVVERDVRMDAPLAVAEARLRDGRERAAIVTAVRSLYKRVGLDPTKVRPSSEALLRRLRRGDALPRINSAVDVCNWCSVETGLPYGLYDLDRVQGDVEARLGAPGEEYPGIRKDVVHLEGRLVLADAIGPFGNPTSDSARTMVSTGASRLLFVIFGPRSLEASVLDDALALTAERAVTYTGGRECLRIVR